MRTEVACLHLLTLPTRVHLDALWWKWGWPRTSVVSMPGLRRVRHYRSPGQGDGRSHLHSPGQFCLRPCLRLFTLELVSISCLGGVRERPVEDGRIYQKQRATAQTVSFGLSSWKCLLPVLEASCSPAFPPLLMGPVDSGKVYCEGWELPSLPRLPQGSSFSCCLGIHGDRTVEPEGNLELIPSFYRWWHCHLWLLPLAFHSQ